MTSGQAPAIVVGYDGTPASKRALEWADRYAAATGGSLRVVTAWSWPWMYGTAMVVSSRDLKGEAKTLAETGVAASRLPARRVEGLVVEGSAVDVLLEQAKGADLLVLGTHGGTPVGRALLGSVSHYCLHHVAIPVVVVHAEEDAA